MKNNKSNNIKLTRPNIIKKNNSTGGVNLNNIPKNKKENKTVGQKQLKVKFGIQNQLDDLMKNTSIVDKNKKPIAKKANKEILSENEKKELYVHLGEQEPEYLTYETLDNLIIKISQEFENDEYNSKIMNARNYLYMQYIPLVNNMTTKEFKENKDSIKQKFRKVFNQHLK